MKTMTFSGRTMREAIAQAQADYDRTHPGRLVRERPRQ